MDKSNLSKTVSHALRHEPWVYELELDEEGWVEVSSLIDSLREGWEDWSDLAEDDLIRMIESSEKRRHEILNGRIRAIYGHSIPQRLSRTPSSPPAILFHGTSPDSIESIRNDGLKPMNRQNVHLSVDEATAKEVGRRKSKEAIEGQRKDMHSELQLFWRRDTDDKTRWIPCVCDCRF